MSDLPISPRPPARQPRDRGMTLPELLIAVTIIGLIVTVLSSALIVTMRQESSTEGRLNVARAEQNIGMWLPGDLASAATVSTDPMATPCGADACPDFGLGPGSNALLISWSVQNQGSSDPPTFTYTNVSYFFSQAPDGSFMLTRIECTNAGSGWSCATNTVLTDLPGPPGGEPWEPGVTVPSWVIQVSQPLEADAVDESDVVVGDTDAKNAKRVVVTVHGGGSSDGAGGGSNTISITAGGTNRNVIDAQSVQGAPSFVEARSRCGGPLTLVVDESQSITSAHIGTVRAGVKQFVTALAGTPVKLQIVAFNDRARALNTTGEWHTYWDMTDEQQVDDLLALIDDPTHGIKIGGGGGSGYTNWEEGLFHSFRNEDGSVAQIVPEKWVFFTDGVPNRDRQSATYRNGALPAQPEPSAPGWGATNTGTAYNQVAFNRANFFATWARSSVRLIGVAVGPEVTNNSTWVANPAAGYHMLYEASAGWVWEERSTFTYQERSSWDEEERSTWTYQRLSGGVWVSTTKSTYHSNNTVPGDSDGWRRSNPSGGWVDMTQSQFHANNTTNDESDGVRRDDPSGSWTNTTKARYDINNVTANDSDGVRRTNPSGSWVSITEAEYNARNVTSDESDGVRRTGNGTWTTITQSEYNSLNQSSGESDGYRETKVYASPYTAYDPLVGSSVPNNQIIGRLIAGGDNYVPAVPSGDSYSNVAEANLYTSSNWSQLGNALKAVALGECGGTLTLQTRLNGAPAADPFSYQNTEQYSASGEALVIPQTVVRTNRQLTTGTFDFDISDGLHRDIVVLPNNLADLGSYSHVSWSCRAGVTDRPFTLVDIPDSTWKGIRVEVGANEAVSCIQTVAK
jgi:prepilin-type N-terminal cleavage/methylation domain-containing protein